MIDIAANTHLNLFRVNPLAGRGMVGESHHPDGMGGNRGNKDRNKTLSIFQQPNWYRLREIYLG